MQKNPLYFENSDPNYERTKTKIVINSVQSREHSREKKVNSSNNINYSILQYDIVSSIG